MKYAALIALMTLVACGAEAPPQAPTPSPGVSMSGEARIGVSGRL